MSPVHALVAKLAADVEKASAAGTTTRPKQEKKQVITSVVGKIFHIECENGHRVEPHRNSYRHTDHPECGSNRYHPVIQDRVSDAAREAYLAERGLQEDKR